MDEVLTHALIGGRRLNATLLDGSYDLARLLHIDSSDKAQAMVAQAYRGRLIVRAAAGSRRFQEYQVTTLQRAHKGAMKKAKARCVDLRLSLDLKLR